MFPVWKFVSLSHMSSLTLMASVWTSVYCLICPRPRVHLSLMSSVWKPFSLSPDFTVRTSVSFSHVYSPRSSFSLSHMSPVWTSALLSHTLSVGIYVSPSRGQYIYSHSGMRYNCYIEMKVKFTKINRIMTQRIQQQRTVEPCRMTECRMT
jgi:hypothetical protein